MLNTEQLQFDSNVDDVHYTAWNYSANEKAALRTASALRGLIKLLMDLAAALRHKPKNSSFLQDINDLELVAHFSDGREVPVPHTIYSQEAKHGLQWLPLEQIPEHFPTNADLRRMADIVIADMVNELSQDDNALKVFFEGDAWDNYEEEDEQEAKNETEDDGPKDLLLQTEPVPEVDLEGTLDARERVAGSIVRRRGQPEFRKALIRAYHSKCAITGCDAVEALEAAHISPYRGPNTNHPSNGLLLRADLHTLFDLGLIAIDARTMTVLIAKNLANTTYAEIAGKVLRLPMNENFCPNLHALDKHRSESRIE